MTEPGWPSGGRPKPQRVWSLWKAGSLMECEIKKRQFGYEVRAYVDGSLVLSFVKLTREPAEARANELNQACLAEGWTDRPPMPE